MANAVTAGKTTVGGGNYRRDGLGQLYEDTYGMIKVTVQSPGFWELRILVGGSPVAATPNAYGWAPQTVAVDIPQVPYGGGTVSAFNVPLTFDANNKPKTYAPVTVRASFYDVIGGTVISTVETAVS